MTTTVSDARIQELLRHESFLRRTLHGLLASEADVEDALQQTYVRILERPGAVPEHPRAWLARVARNVALSGLRSRRNRTDHESAFPESRAEGSPAESLARMEALKRVVTAILELEEPYRSVVLLRYSEDLDVATIAKRLSRTESTVRSQLSRAHELLRAKLDREFGGRERWAVLALRRGATPLSWFVPAAACVVLALGGAAAVLWWPESRTSETRVASLPEMVPAGGEREAPELQTPTAITTEVTRQESASGSSAPRRLPAAELFDRKRYKDYELATFSFVHGLRDDPGLEVTRNDWDIEYQGDMFDSCTITNDRSVIVDLGARTPQELDGLTLAGLGLAVDKLAERVPVHLGHSYFEWSRDKDTDLACLVFVRELEPGKRCVLDWYASDGMRTQGSLADDGTGERLADTLERMRSEVVASMNPLRAPEVVLQARKGAGGGESRVKMSGVLERVEETSPVPLLLDGELERNEPARAHVQGGLIPLDRAFHVTRIVHSGQVLGDSHGRGLFALVVGGTEIVRSEGKPAALNPEEFPDVEFGARGKDAADLDAPHDWKDIAGIIQLAPTTTVWTGDIRLEPGDEDSTYLAVANASAGEALLVGTFVPRERPRLPETLVTTASRAAPDEPTPVATKLPVLAEPRAVLQARAGAGGGNPNRIDLAGKTSQYVDRVEKLPLDLSQPPAMRDESLVHFVGGHVPVGQVFVVTRATWWSTAAGDYNGHGELKLVVAGKLLAERRDAAEPESGAWSGLLRIRPGQESETYLEIANSSAADVLLLGYFEALEK